MSKEITCEVLHIFSKEKYERGGETVIQVVKWGKNPPTLERRSYYVKDGKTLPGKASGFRAADFKIIAKHNKEIKALLKREEE